MAYKLLEGLRTGCSTRTMRQVSTNVSACVALADSLSPVLTAAPLCVRLAYGFLMRETDCCDPLSPGSGVSRCRSQPATSPRRFRWLGYPLLRRPWSSAACPQTSRTTCPYLSAPRRRTRRSRLRRVRRAGHCDVAGALVAHHGGRTLCLRAATGGCGRDLDGGPCRWSGRRSGRERRSARFARRPGSARRCLLSSHAGHRPGRFRGCPARRQLAPDYWTPTNHGPR